MTKYECMGCAVTFTGEQSTDKDNNPACPSCNDNAHVWEASCYCDLCCPEGHCGCSDCDEPCDCEETP